MYGRLFTIGGVVPLKTTPKRQPHKANTMLEDVGI